MSEPANTPIVASLGAKLANYVRQFISPTGLSTPGYLAPEFTIVDTNGKPHTLKRHVNSVIILRFCATWCAGCRWEEPGWKMLVEKYRESGLVVIGAYANSIEDVRAHKAKENLNFPCGVSYSKLLWDYRVYPTGHLPASVCIDRRGIVYDNWKFYHTPNWYEGLITPLLKKA